MINIYLRRWRCKNAVIINNGQQTAIIFWNLVEAFTYPTLKFVGFDYWGVDRMTVFAFGERLIWDRLG